MTIFDDFTQPEKDYGGVHTPPENRLFMLALARMYRAKDILELGCDLGYTTRALAMTGENVTGVDNVLHGRAIENTEGFPKCQLVQRDALDFLADQQDESFDFIFVDDRHEQEHVAQEAIHVKRILRNGGIAAFHDPIYHPHIEMIVRMTFAGWFMWFVPAISPKEDYDFGFVIVQKPTT